MRKNFVRTTALALSATLIMGIGATAVYAHNNKNLSSAKPRPAGSAAVSASKDETVYVLSGADGQPQQVIVSNWLQNGQKADTLRDQSTLSNIQNVKGMEDYTVSKDGSLLWNAAGRDIYYQGTTDQTVPVEMKISYTLDGKAITPQELAGKSGRVTIRFDYKNTQSKNVKIGKTQQKMFVPFVMITGTMLDPDIFHNVTVTNAKMENLGNQIAIVGIALPGMQENLNISKETLEIPSYIEITADTDRFELGTTMTIGTTSLFRELQTEDLSAADLKDQAKKLTDGVRQLMDGSDQLYNGLSTLLEQAGLLADGIDKLAVGASQLESGVDTLNGGASQLQSGASALSSGLNTLDSNSSALKDGARQVFNSLLSAANEQIAAAGQQIPGLTIDNYADVLNAAISSLDENAVYQVALEQVTAGVNARRDEVEAAVTEVIRQKVEAEVLVQVTAGVRENVTAAVQAQEENIRALVIFKVTGLTPEQYQAAIDAGSISQEQQQAIEGAVTAAMEAEVEKQMGSEKVQATISALTAEKTDEQMKTSEIQATIAENVDLQIEKLISETMASEEIQAKLQAAAEGAKALIGLKSSLDSYNSFYLGLLAYTSGVSAAASGAGDLVDGVDALCSGTDSLRSGAGDLTDGINTMQSKTPALLDGISALRDGSKALKDGLDTLMKEGIQKISDLAEEDLDQLITRLDSTVEAAKDYNTFSGLDSAAEGSVKFIYKTASVSVND